MFCMERCVGDLPTPITLKEIWRSGASRIARRIPASSMGIGATIANIEPDSLVFLEWWFVDDCEPDGIPGGLQGRPLDSVLRESTPR